MASSSQGLRIGIQILLAIIIVGLSYYLYLSITEPYEVIRQQQVLTEQTRERMTVNRQALIVYETRYDRFPGSLDSLVFFVRDSLTAAERDSIFGAGFNADSLIYSPRSGALFNYTAVDTTRVPTYLLQDPDSDDQIGTLQSDVTRINAATWE